ncbi:RNA polymerase sigma factor [Gelidibacter sp. F63206]|uniref:RNA polymerase sigma factor n=1 Tax=Gelidibacter sp. F63206 TaxID=2926425 RepID=UPI001FF47712|nr:sigma-70 family RNA polymerase sigma factor [Gelidibacter sp. F63206]MCK0114916.1 sigma-70 family RNA polymerase sigma factor [Gelidibacter sp. F63206]
MVFRPISKLFNQPLNVFEEVYKSYWQKIFRLCMGYVNDRDLAKDLAQETFIVVFKKLPEFRYESKIGTWIFRIATNICLRQIEREKRFPQDELPKNLSQENVLDIEPQIKFLYKCISELAETDRIIISLELENVKQEDIASIVGISYTNVRVRIHRIKEKIKIKFKEYGQ